MLTVRDANSNIANPTPPLTAMGRLKTDYRNLIADPVPSITAHPLPENILEWHFLILGAEDTPYAGEILNICINNLI